MCDIQPNIDATDFKLSSEQISKVRIKGERKRVPLEQLVYEFEQLEQIDLTKDSHKKEMHELFPRYLLEGRDDVDWRLFLSMSRYDRRNNTLVVGCFDNQMLKFKLISYKWRYKDGIKWKTRAGTSPNNTPLIRIYTDERAVYVIEGHRDSVTAILLGLDFIMLPYAGYRIKKNISLIKEVTDRRLIFLVEDEAAYKCMLNVASILKNTASDIELKNLVSHEGKVDLSDYVRKFNSIKEVINGLQD